ncbi:lysine 2,3-aminomutase [Nonomuraea sp. NN258]|uniref:KamA family radical SAM protein n=1 Tax=Nonomuraea antri TaxID=2730852 RepID=UPI00156A0E31|nr:lysine 2,3-aminomutase [Nonomuraea antri]NRQ37778.1 lysine 2,3-aminomutase [Nonomuraea antri]
MYTYRQQELVEPDWRRFPGWKDVTVQQWRDVQWQRAHCVKTVRQLRAVTGDLVGDAFFADLVRDQTTSATMSMLLTPQLINTMAPHTPPDDESLRADPVRRYMMPIASDRRTDWPSHPYASRDSLHEAEMWVTEGLTHRYPTKVLAEVVPTCPQYCGHCTRMDLVGPSTPGVDKYRFALRPADRLARILDYLRATPTVRDVVVSGGDVANLPWPHLEDFLTRLLTIESVRDIRLASKALVGLPQHWLVPSTVAGIERIAAIAAKRGVSVAMHTHANAASQVTPLVAEASRTMLAAGLRDVRNQGVLLAGVNDTPQALLDLCFALLNEASVTPYYFYLCDVIPQAEHWRLPLHRAQSLQDAIMGYLPGFATPRLVCDVPYAGKRWVHQVVSYDRVRGISTWAKEFRGPFDEADDAERRYEYVDPIHTLPAEGRLWWTEQTNQPQPPALTGAR